MTGALQAANGAPSSEHSSATGPGVPPSVTVTSTSRLRELVIAGGAAVTVVVGGSASRVHEASWGVGSAMLPRRARTAKLWSPSPVTVSVSGEVHGAQAPPSTMHSKVAPIASVVKVKLTSAFCTVPLGLP